MELAMRIFPPHLEIGEQEGFEKDLFNRSHVGKGLQNLVATITDPMVLALDGPWGTGKSTFLRMWAGDLRKAGFPVVYFDAFEHDYLDDAFLALAGEIVGLAQEKKRSNDPKAKRFLQRAVGAGKVVAKSGAKIGVKALTLAAVSDDDLKDLAKAISDEAGHLTDKALEELLKGHRKGKSDLGAFRDALTDLPSLLADPSAEMPASESRPLILIVDELDRCRPAFALEIIERAKHFFSVKNVHFVLGANLKQLENSVVTAYGSGIDAQTYLQKFIHLTINLDETAESKHERVSRKYLNRLIKVVDFPADAARDVSTSIDVIDHVANQKNLSLRTVERIVSVLSVGLAFTTDRHFRVAPLIAGLAVIKVTNPVLYQSARRGQLSYDEVVDALVLDSTSEDLNVEWLAKWWQFVTDPAMSRELQDEFRSTMFSYNFGGRLKIVPFLCTDIMDRFLPS